MRTTLALSATLWLAACSGDLLLSPPSIPSGSELSDYSAKNFNPNLFIGATPQDTLVIGVAYVDEQCARFFDAVEEMNRQSKVLQSVALSAGTQITALMSVAKRSALAIAEVASAVEVTKVLFEQYRAEFGFAPHSVELRAITLQAMKAQKKELEALVIRGQIVSHVQVISGIKQYAQNCTLAQIHEHWNNAISKAVREGVTTELPTSKGPGATRSFGQSGPGSVLGINKYVVR